MVKNENGEEEYEIEESKFKTYFIIIIIANS